MAAVIVSLTLAVAVPVPTTRLSKLPPETPVMVRRQAGGVAVDVLAVAGRQWSACRWWRHRQW